MDIWSKYDYVCHTCDALIEYTLELSSIPADVDVTELTCVCGGIAGQMSVVDATIVSAGSEYLYKRYQYAGDLFCGIIFWNT